LVEIKQQNYKQFSMTEFRERQGEKQGETEWSNDKRLEPEAGMHTYAYV